MYDRLALFSHFEGKRHILIDCHMRIECVRLEDHRDISVFRFHAVHAFPAEEQIPLRDRGQSCDHPEQRALAAAGRTENNTEILVIDLKVDVPDCEILPAFIFLSEINQFYFHGVLLALDCTAGKSRYELILQSDE